MLFCFSDMILYLIYRGKDNSNKSIVDAME